MSRWAAVIGSPIAHSLSPVLHRAAWASLGVGDGDEGGPWRYERLEQTAQTLPAFIRDLDADCLGLSVTMPCKQAVIPLLDVVEPMAQAVGAVNTVVPSGGVLSGFNTDVHGIVAALTGAREAAGLTGAPDSAVILGARATASSALVALRQLHVGRIALVARRFGGPGSALTAAARLGVEVDRVAWADADAVVAAVEDADIVISTMPAGVPDAVASRVRVRTDQTLLDVVYAPRKTALVRAFGAVGAVVAEGLDMLLHQAVQQVVLMTGREPSVPAMRWALVDALARRA